MAWRTELYSGNRGMQMFLIIFYGKIGFIFPVCQFPPLFRFWPVENAEINIRLHFSRKFIVRDGNISWFVTNSETDF